MCAEDAYQSIYSDNVRLDFCASSHTGIFAYDRQFACFPNAAVVLS